MPKNDENLRVSPSEIRDMLRYIDVQYVAREINHRPHCAHNTHTHAVIIHCQKEQSFVLTLSMAVRCMN